MAFETVSVRSDAENVLGDIRVDRIDGVDIQLFKIFYGAEGALSSVSLDQGLPVTITDGTNQLAINESGQIEVSDGGGSLTVDASSGSPVFVRLSDGTDPLTTLPVSLSSVPSHHVTNEGTFAVQAAQSGSWTVTANAGTGTFAISASSLPLPTGAATAANQPAIGTAGTASSDVITVQGIASMTPLLVDGSGATQPVSGTVTANAGTGTFAISASSLPLPTGAATAANQPALGTAGSAASDVITVQGIASMTPLLVDASGAAVPVTDNGGSLTVDAPVGTPVYVRLSDGATPISTLPVSLATVPSHDVTNAGTFAVQASQSGTWNITNISGSVSLPTGAATAANQSTIIGHVDGIEGLLTTIDSDMSTLAGAVSGTEMQVDVVAALPAGTNVIGDVSLAARTTGGLSPHLTISAASTNATSVKGSAGRLYGLQVFNTSESPAYVKFYDKATAPTVGSDTPVRVIMIPGNASGSGAIYSNPVGLSFSSGIAFAITSGAAHSDTGAVGANEVIVNLDYA